MNTVQKLDQSISAMVDIQRCHTVIERREMAIHQQMLKALKHRDRIAAQRLFDRALQWNEFATIVASWRDTVLQPQRLTYIVDGWFLEDLVCHLTKGTDEDITHVTGPRVGSVRTLSRICRLTAEERTAVYARGTAKSCADTEIEILEHGNLLHAMAHSHPGKGAGATTPSSIDTNYLGKIQRAGSDAIGIIVTRDGWIRFFSVIRPFRVFVMGTGVTQLEEYVYQVKLPSQDRHS